MPKGMGGYAGKSVGKKIWNGKGGKASGQVAEQQRRNLGKHERPVKTTGGKHGRSYSNFK